jgi:hypothetical protein
MRSRSCLSSSSICSETRFASASAARRALRSSGVSEAWLARMAWEMGSTAESTLYMLGVLIMLVVAE